MVKNDGWWPHIFLPLYQTKATILAKKNHRLAIFIYLLQKNYAVTKKFSVGILKQMPE
jgi:hypothetical protein